MSSMVGLPSDRAFAEVEECLSWMTKYANNQDLFFEDFGKAFVKLVDSGARWRSSRYYFWKERTPFFSLYRTKLNFILNSRRNRIRYLDTSYMTKQHTREI